MTKVIIEKVDGVEKATAVVNFDLGNVLREEVSEDGKTNNIVVGMYVDSTANYLRQLAYEKAESKDWEGFKSTLDEYTKLMIQSMIGVDHYPINYDKNGVLKGLKDDVEVEVEE